jgi:hypothetical protein
MVIKRSYNPHKQKKSLESSKFFKIVTMFYEEKYVDYCSR